ncbi:hypothetical protein [Microbacterium halophytorum]|uniref:hypothetical protein n=1 Tax=Microbacterium halophytorum TaxID=2067568 RepID=UPI000CFE2147|nr:hypothetical protein [Microbacterium halophytorum]
MFLLSIILFIGGIALFGVAFMPFITVGFVHALVFALGIVAVCLAMALPIHAKSGAKYQR